MFRCADAKTRFTTTCHEGSVEKFLAEPTAPEDRAALVADRAAIEELFKFRELVDEFAGASAKGARPKEATEECARRQRGRTKDIDGLHGSLTAAVAKAPRPWVATVVPAFESAMAPLRECVDCVEAHRATCKKAAPSLEAATRALEQAGVVPAGRFGPIKTDY